MNCAHLGSLRQRGSPDTLLVADARRQAVAGVIVEVHEQFAVRWHCFDDLEERLTADLRRDGVHVVDVGGRANEADPVTVADLLVLHVHDLVNASKTISNLKEIKTTG